MLWLSCRSASEFFARASVEITVAVSCISGASHVAASPIACGNTVAYPDRAIPCSPSLHQSYSGISSRGIATAWFCICDTFSGSVIFATSAAARCRGVCVCACMTTAKLSETRTVAQHRLRRKKVFMTLLVPPNRNSSRSEYFDRRNIYTRRELYVVNSLSVKECRRVLRGGSRLPNSAVFTVPNRLAIRGRRLRTVIPGVPLQHQRRRSAQPGQFRVARHRHARRRASQHVPGKFRLNQRPKPFPRRSQSARQQNQFRRQRSRNNQQAFAKIGSLAVQRFDRMFIAILSHIQQLDNRRPRPVRLQLRVIPNRRTRRCIHFPASKSPAPEPRYRRIDRHMPKLPSQPRPPRNQLSIREDRGANAL